MRLKKRFVAWLSAGVMVVSSVQFPVSHVHAGEIQTDEVVAETNEKETENAGMGSESDKEYELSVTEEQKEFSEEHEETEQVATETEYDNSIQDESELESNMETEETQEENKAVDISDAKVVTSGSCGEKVTYVLDSDGVLTISGSGAMNGTPWYNNRLEIKVVVIEKGVTSIGSHAFTSCSNLTRVEIPDSVTSIEDYAFGGCISLTKIEIPDSVMCIGIYAFNGCNSLVEVDISKSLEDIEGCLFYGCSSLERVEIPDSVTKIGKSAFYECSSLVNIGIPSSVTCIEDYAFAGCSNITKIEIPNSVTSIGMSIFSNCSNLESVKIPNSVTMISSYTFSKCSNLTSIEIPDSVMVIGVKAFSDCSSLIEIKIPNSVTNIAMEAFSGCSSLVKVELPNTLTYINSQTFSGCGNLKSIVIPDGVIEIGWGAFIGCSSLTEVEISHSVTNIANYAFRNCSSLVSIEIPDSVISIGTIAFSGCSSLTAIKILNFDCSIADDNYTIPANTTIYAYTDSLAQAYAEKYSRKFVSLGEAPEEPAEVLSGNCGKYGSNVTFVLDSDGILTISGSGDMCDYGITDKTGAPWVDYRDKIKSVVIMDGVTRIGMSAFGDCQNLISVKIPIGLTSIGHSAFRLCTSLESIELPLTVTELEGAVFRGCGSLKDVKIPFGITNIQYDTFRDCNSLMDMEIPSTVTNIGNGAFGDCESLTSIKILNPNCFIEDDSYTISDSATIYGYTNSTAQEYAEKYNRKFVSLGTINGVELLLPKSDDSTLSGSENWIMLSGTLRVDDDSLDIESEISAIKWNSSDNLIVSENDIICKKSSLIDNKSTKLTIAIKAKGCGVVTLTGTTSSETSSSCELTIEPEMILESEDLNSNKVRNITCTVNIPNSNRDYLNQFMKRLTWNIPDTDVSIVNKKGTYNISDNGKSATYTLQVIPKINNGKTEIAFISPKGHVTRINKSVDIYPSWGFENYCAPEFKSSPAYNELFMKLGLSGMFYFVLKQDTVKNGVCHGMAVTALLMEQDEYNYREFDNTKDSLYRIDELSDTIDRFIQYHYMMQFTKASKEFDKNFQKNSVKKQLEIIASMKEPFLLGYSSIKGGHTVVGYKIEEGRWISGATGRIYPKRVVVYDSNNVNGNDDGRNFLFDEDNGTWEVPAYYVKYKFSSDFSLSKITCATSDQNDFCNIDLTRASRADGDSVALTLILNSDINVELSKNSVNGVVNHVHNICGPYYSEKDDVFATPIMGINDSVEDTVPYINIYMPKTDKVIIKPKTKGVGLDGNIWNSNSFGLDFSAERYNAVEIDSDGSVSMLGSLGNFNITTVLESDIFNNVDGISIDGKGEGSVSTKIAKDGIILRADRLDGFKVSIYDVESNSTISGVDLSTDKESVLIDTTNDDHLSILEDSNGDGQYNYEITRIDYNDNDTYRITYDVDGGIVEGNPTSYTEDALPIKLNNPTKIGYAFTGWTGSNGSVPQLTVVIAKGTTRNLSYTANWKKNDESSENDVLPEDIPADGKIPDGLWIAGINTYTYTGKPIKPEVRVYDSNRLLKAGQDYTISYKNNTKANDASNESTAPAVVVKGKGNYTGTERQTFKILPLDLNDTTIAADDITVACNKKVQKKVPVVTYNGKKLAKNRDFTISYPSQGTDAYKSAGTYKILLTAKHNGNFTGTRTVQFTITNNILINTATVKKIANQTYTGKAIEPNLEVTMKKAPLVKNTDYTVTYTNNIESGTATAILTGIGKYAGTKKVTFKINGISLKGAVVSGITDKVYSGTAQEQQISVMLNNKSLTENVDYEVVYSQNINAGKATVTIKGIKAYSGTVKKTFKITAYDMKENAGSQIGGLGKEITAKYLKGGSKPKLELTFAGKKLIEGTDYTVSCQNNKIVTTADTKSKPTITIKGKGNFKGSLTKTFTIIGKALNDTESPVTLNVADKGFVDKAGKYISVPVLIDTDGKKLAAGKDYESIVVYSLEDGTELTKNSKVNAGTKVKVRVTGKGAYTGELVGGYQITQNDFNKAKISISPQTYTGKAVTLNKDSVTVKIGKETLTFGTDYEIVENSYANNVKKGTASVTIVGKGNYGGTKTVKFKITARKLSWFWRLFG